ncbi:hypothetical protein [Nocardia heshunensis]
MQEDRLARGRAYIRFEDGRDLEVGLSASSVSGFMRVLSLVLVALVPPVLVGVCCYFALPVWAVLVVCGIGIAAVVLLTLVFVWKPDS